MDENSHDDNEVWTPPESTQEPYPMSYEQPRASSSYQSNVVYSTSTLTFPVSSTQNVQSYGSQFIPQEYHHPDSARGLPYTDGSYHITASQSQIYQAAQSSFDRMSPVEDYRPSGSDNISYSGLGPDSGQLITGVVDSSTLHQSYPVHQVVFQGSDHRIMTVQRVNSPVDTTVSQSALGLQHQDSVEDQQPTHAMLTPVPVSCVRSYSMYPSHGEVTTTGGTSMMSHRQEAESDPRVSSISESLHSRMMQNVSKVEETVSGEPDTTQEDNDDYAPHVRSYIVEESNSIDTEPVLHSTMMGTPRGSVVMDSTTGSSQLSSSRISHYSREVESSADSSLGEMVSNGPSQSSVSVNMSGLVTVEGLHSTLDDQSLDDKDELTSNMGIPTILNVSVRKSNRIAEMENDLPSYQKPKYIPKQYNVNEIWCEECMTSYDIECPTHRLTLFPDKVVLSRAWASLPQMLQIFRLEDASSQYGGEAHVGVFAKRTIPRCTQFGPFIGELVQSKEDIQSTKFLLMLERQEGDVLYFDTSDENKCNWMMFVRPAENFAEQNMVAYQHGFDIYFSVTKNIDIRTELKVWYATHYARRHALHTLEITQQDIDVLDEQECKYQCYECAKRFKTSIALQRHLITHEPGAPQPSTSTESHITPSTSTSEENDISTYSAIKKKYKQPLPKKTKDFSDTSGYMWKKKSTSIYLNKTLKKYQKRHDSEAIRRTIQSMYRRKGKECGGNEWLCVHCDLTFDNSNLLNLHTLTHAADEVGFDEVYKFAYKVNENGEFQQPGTSTQNTDMYALEPSMLACPVCHAQFQDQRALIEHAAEHGKSKSFLSRNRTHKCSQCWKAFHSREKLNRHMLCHGSEENKPLQCTVCYKRFMNNSALSCHMKTHSDKKYYECPICKEGFNHSAVMREHVVIHAQNGIYTCPQCQREFDDFYNLRKHIRGFHTNKEFPCPHCDKVFPRPDKLKLHMLKHSNHREFMCETCGRQFKRKDKLKEHIRRMHSLERELKNMAKGEKPSPKKFIPKVSPTDYHRFIYKCHTCMLGFKRRGMLVNHLAKRHPDVKFETVPELNLPILKTQKDYYCQYCDKVYKSSSKRKTHILKNHPGAELPMSARKKTVLTELPGIPNPTFSQTVGSITTMPHLCEYCHKQYASKAKLTQHQRKKHPDAVPPLPPKPKRESLEGLSDAQSSQETLQQIVRYEPADSIVTVQSATGDGQQAADLLTQAMSELTQSVHTDYRQQSSDYQSRLAPTIMQLAHPGSTIDLSHLNQALQQGQLGQALAHAFVQPSGIGGPIQIAVSGPLSALSQLQHNDGIHQPRDVTQEEPSTTGPQILNSQTIVVSGTHHPQIVPISVAPSVAGSKWTSYTNYR
ncbi:PR domain zinc finger protein 10-like isoform X1 [Mytilus californianus]|uniref:PR domain zinc finger protein 10-like isoform X1 n=2 Tax=Mytilus californianus TaxID=6549 RepID=UPI002246D8D7|nr:PR domain zinc finger protein 10-like isoform X1 [Mytilus californianus]